MSLPFQFKQFSVAQDKCAMKIGTDGVLLGAWVNVKQHPKSILDIGSGTGVIALQLAQRSDAGIIDAVEIDDDTHEQCSDNFEHSPWGDRLFCYHASIQEFASEIEEKYDLIVSNPPFYSEDYKTGTLSRDRARFNDSLPFKHLFVCASHLLEGDGTFALIFPKYQEENLIKLAAESGLHPKRICRVKGSHSSEEKRSLIEFTTSQQELKREELTIENGRHNYTPKYIDLVKDFYLKM